MTEDTTPKRIPPPDDLARDGRKDGPGRRLWKSIAGSGQYVLRPDELRILHAACRCDDAIAELRRKKAELENNPQYEDMLVKGSMGQRIENPLRAAARKITDEIRAQDSALTGHLGKLKLPDLDVSAGDSSPGQPRSVGARAAANSRWGKTG
ncbi:hypothetical protein [Arthrobacter sp. SLBN-53]|uniref:hypothetical protein n=1 Tax=Arthrobacter sp. SLBN-53 TaxID=2768412 RepID=UPI00116B7239|nr:hypothetical protein [Arthrobacter sp. SLBN-53]TQK29392.1 hypothetical protein FBY28_2395 [Arthrobacter sp. SLBN-53]